MISSMELLIAITNQNYASGFNLVGYFTHVFDSLDPFYRQATAEILLVTMEAIRPLSVLAITF